MDKDFKKLETKVDGIGKSLDKAKDDIIKLQTGLAEAKAIARSADRGLEHFKGVVSELSKEQNKISDKIDHQTDLIISLHNQLNGAIFKILGSLVAIGGLVFGIIKYFF